MMHIGEKIALHLSNESEATSTNNITNDGIVLDDKIPNKPELEITNQPDEGDNKETTYKSNTPPQLPPRYSESNSTINSSKNDIGEQTYDNKTLLEQQRLVIKSLYLDTMQQLQDGDSVYLFPTAWFKTFIHKPVEELPDTMPLKEVLGVPELPEEIDHTNYQNFISSKVFMPLTSDVLSEIYKYYGFKGNIIEAFCTLDSTGTLIIDPIVLNFQTSLLVENTWQTSQTEPIQFNGSRHSTLARLFQLAANYLEQHLSLESVDKRFWLSVSDKKENKVQSFLLLPQQFLTLNDIEYVDHSVADKKLLNFSNDKIISLIIEVNFTGSWPSLYHLYNNKESSDSLSAPSAGTLGLHNLGNTCYMNSALQCLVHIPELADYFSYGCYQDELNLDNPLGYDGKIAKSFGELVEELYGRSLTSQSTNGKSIAPRNFKMNLGFCNQMFSGYFQQDSQEFLSFLLDGLHEDLNRIKKKPYVENAQYGLDFDWNDKDKIANLAKETWEKYKLRNDSVIIDLFVGLFKSTLICPDCNHLSITFDPFNDLSLPIPVESTWRKQIYVLPLNDTPHTLELELRDDSKYQDLKNEVARYVETDVDNLVGFEFYSSSIYKCFENDSSGANFLPIGDLINTEDITFFIEIGPFNPETDIIIPVYNVCETSSKKFSNMVNDRLCGYPLLVKFEKKKLGDFEYITTTIGKFISNYTNLDFTDITDEFENEESSKFDKKLENLTKEYDLNEDFITELQNYKKIWILYRNISKHLEFLFLENRETIDLENNDPKNKTQKVQIPIGRLNLNNAFELSNLSGTIFEKLFEDEIEEMKDSDSFNNIDNNNSLSSPPSSSELSSIKETEIASHKDEDIPPKHTLSDVEMVKVPSNVSIMDDDSQKKEVTEEEKRMVPSEILYNNLTKKDGIFIISWKMSQEEQERFYKTPKTYKNDQLQEKKLKMAKTEKKNITLNDCLNLFTKTETLSLQNSWYCPNCKDHKQADKQIQLWELPEVLCIHLKRFKNQSSFSDKINELIEFPIENFDLSSYVTKSDSGKEYIYDLVGVDNHYGGIGGGHYTAFAKNFNDSNWYYFNDSRVTKENVEDSVNEAAYLLFYKRRNGLDPQSKLVQIVNEKKAEYEKLDKLLDERQKHVAIMLKNRGVSILDDSDEETTSSGEDDVSEEQQENGNADILEKDQSIEPKFTDEDIEDL